MYSLMDTGQRFGHRDHINMLVWFFIKGVLIIYYIYFSGLRPLQPIKHRADLDRCKQGGAERTQTAAMSTSGLTPLRNKEAPSGLRPLQ